MLFKIDYSTIEQNKRILITNIAQFPILVRILDHYTYNFIPNFSLLKRDECKYFQIMKKQNFNDYNDIIIDAIEFDENKIDSFSVPPFWNEKVQGCLQTQSLSLPATSNVNRSERLPSINQTFQDQKIGLINNDNTIKFNTQILKQNGFNNNNDKQINQQRLNSLQSQQNNNSIKIGDDNNTNQQITNLHINSNNSFESYHQIQTKSFQQPIITMPNDLNQFLDQIDQQYTSPFQHLTPSQQQSQINSQKNISDNAQQDLSLSDTTSIQRFEQQKQSFLQQSKSQFNEKPKLRVSQTFIAHPKPVIESQKYFDKNKEIEFQIQKQIAELRISKESLSTELQQLKFKAMFHTKNKQSTYQYDIYIWHLLLTSVVFLIIGSILKKMISLF